MKLYIIWIYEFVIVNIILLCCKFVLLYKILMFKSILLVSELIFVKKCYVMLGIV